MCTAPPTARHCIHIMAATNCACFCAHGEQSLHTIDRAMPWGG